MNTKRNVLAAAVALLLALSLTACSLVSVNEEKDLAQVIAKVGDAEILKSELVDQYEYMVAMYESYYSSLGMSLSPTDKQSIRDSIVENLIETKMFEYQTTLQGYTELSEEKLAELEEEVRLADEEIYGYALADAQAEFEEDPDIVVETRTDEIFLEYTEMYFGTAYNRDDFKTWYRDAVKADMLSDMMIEEFYKTVSVTDEEVRAAFDAQAEEEKTLYEETPGDYKTAQENAEMYDSMPALYTPDGYIRVKYIKIVPEEELSAEYTDMVAEMAELEAELGPLAMEENEENAQRIAEIKTKYAQLKEQSTALRTELFAPSMIIAQEAYTKLETGESFDAVMAEYTMDADMKTYEVFQQKGKLLSAHESTTDWSQEIKDAALALTTPGSYTSIIKDDEGFHILYYVGKETAGERAYSEVQDLIYTETLTTKQSNEWGEMMSAWMADEKIVTRYPDRYSDLGAA